MATRLLIYIPIYNAESRIIRTLDCLCEALKNFSENDVKVHLTDNASTDKTVEIVEHYVRQNKGQISLDVNNNNIGGILNIVNGLKIDFDQEYTWIIGDDDLITPWAIESLFKFLDELDIKQIKVKFIHINCLIVAKNIYDNDQIFNLVKENKVGGFLMNQKFQKPMVTNFSQLVDPIVDDAILGAMFCCIFDSKAVRQKAMNLDYNQLTSDDNTYKSSDWFPHSYTFAKTFSSNDLCLANPVVSIISTVGHQAYWADRSPIIGCASFDNLFEFFDNGAISLIEFDDYMQKFFMRHRKVFSYLVKNKIELLSERKMQALLKAYAKFTDAHIK
jgi:glycosyltransferase involved in cell wall biosynthesis